MLWRGATPIRRICQGARCAALSTPDGRNPCVTMVWAIDPSSSGPRFVTAFPQVRGHGSVLGDRAGQLRS
jgi:hypothetical protein